MQAFYGAYAFPANGTQISSAAETIYNEGGVPYKVRQSIFLAGILSVSGQADAALQESLMRTALAIPFQDFVFLEDNLARTPLQLLNFGSITGVRVVRLRFPKTTGPEYVTIRSFEVELEAEYALPAGSLSPFATFLNFTETLTFEGGYPIFRHRLAVEGDNQKQLVYPRDTYRATQSGTCSGRIRPPVAPSPIWPFALKDSPKFTRTSPKLEGLLFEGYGLTWHYEFEDVGPLIGLPHVWPS